MTKQELNDLCLIYWQRMCYKFWDIMKDYPCDYIDNRIGMRSSVYGEDEECCYALRIDQQKKAICLSNGHKCYYDNSVVIDNTVYGYDEIDSKTMETFVSMVLYIAKHETEIDYRMEESMNLINYIKNAVAK